MTFTPKNGNIIVEKIEEKTVSDSGIILASGMYENKKERPVHGIVKKVADDVTEISEGDEVVYGLYAKRVIDLQGRQYTILFKQDVLGVVEK